MERLGSRPGKALFAGGNGYGDAQEGPAPGKASRVEREYGGTAVKAGRAETRAWEPPVLAFLDLPGPVTDEAVALAEVGASVGVPLPEHVAARLGMELGHDFGHVRVHTDAIAAAAAARLGARAFTIGSDVYFAAGAYAPDSIEGEALLVHELTHVVQHDRGALAAVPEGASRVVSPDDAHEQEARAAAGRPRGTGGDAHGPTTARSTGGRTAGGRAPILRDVHGVPNEGNDCFLASVLQVLATSYRELFDVGVNAVAPARRLLQRAVFDHLERLRGADEPGFVSGDTKALRALLQAHDRMIESRSAQEDAAGLLRKLVSFVTELEGRSIQVGDHHTVVAPERTTLAQLAHDHGTTVDALRVRNPSLAAIARYLFDQQTTNTYDDKDAKARTAGVDERDPPRFGIDHASRTQQADLSTVQIEMSEYESFEQFMAHRFGAGVDVELDEKNRLKALDGADAPIAISKFHQTLTFARLPEVMTFSVGRFGIDATGEPAKFNETFPMPGEVVLKEQGSGGTMYKRYRLEACVHHHGTTAHGGHYTAQVREDDDWSTADDERVAGHSEAAPRNLDSGYLYTYRFAEESDQPLTVAAVQEVVAKPQPKRRNHGASWSDAWSGARHGGTDAGATAVETTDKRGLPNQGRNQQGKSDCFLNAIVQLAAGPYRASFDPKVTPLVDEADTRLQGLVWNLIQKIHKEVSDPATASEIAALRKEMVGRKFIASTEGQEDAGEVLMHLLGMVRNGAPPELRTSTSRTLDTKDATVAVAQGGEQQYTDGVSTGATAGNGVLPVDIGQFGSLHHYLYDSFGGGSVATRLDAKNRARVTNTVDEVASTMNVTGYVDRGRLTQLPPVLTFYLRRMLPGRPVDLRSFYMPPQLTLVEQGEPAKSYAGYRLDGVVTWHASHYTARVAHDDQWYDFNDERVTASTGTGDVLTHGYLYTYVHTGSRPDAGTDVVLQDQKPSTGTLPIDADLAIDFDSNAIVHGKQARDLRVTLQRIANHYPVLIDGEKTIAVAQVMSLVEGLGQLSAAKLTAEDERATGLAKACRELMTALGAKTLDDAFAGHIASPVRGETQYEARAPMANARLVREVKGTATDLGTLTTAELRGAIGRGELTADAAVTDYLHYRARKDFYGGVHLVYDLDQTLLTYVDGKFAAPQEHGEVTGTLALDCTTKKQIDYPYEIDALVPDASKSGAHTHTYRRHGDGWRQHYREKTRREQHEQGGKTDTLGRKLEGDATSTETPTQPETPSPIAKPFPSNQKGSNTGVRAMSVRPGAIDGLTELADYGVHQSVWTNNNAHHMHRVLELLEAKGFAEHRFEHTIGGQAAHDQKKRLHDPIFPTKSEELTVLLDDMANRGNHRLGNLKSDSFAPLGGERRAELQVPAFGDANDDYHTEEADRDLLQMMGDTMLVKLALAQVKPQTEEDDPLARAYLDAIAATLSPETPIADDALVAAVGKGRAVLRERFARWQRPQPRPEVGDPSLFALAPSLGTSYIVPSSLPDPSSLSTMTDEEIALAKKKAGDNFKKQNVVSRGLVETELHDAKRFVRVYQAEANPIPVKDVPTTGFKDVHQHDGAIELVRGKGAVCFSVGTPLRTLKWFEKYQEEHFGKGFNPVIRSFLIPLETYLDLSSRANVQEQTPHARFEGQDFSNNVDIAGDTDQYETRDADLDRLRSAAVSGSLVSWVLDPKRIEVDVSGDLRPVSELYDRLGIPPFYGILTALRPDGDTYDPFTERGGHRLGQLGPRANQLGELQATYLEREDGTKPDTFVELSRPNGPPKRDLKARLGDLDGFVRMHFFNPPEGKRLAAAEALEQKRLADKVQSYKTWVQTLSAASDGDHADLYQQLLAARVEYREYLATVKQPASPAWDDLPTFYAEVIVPLVREKDRYAIRMTRIEAEHRHHDEVLASEGKPVPKWDHVEFLMRVVVPGAATQFAVTDAIGQNLDEARSDLGQRNPTHTRSFDEHWQDHVTGVDPHQAPADTPMKTIDYGARKADDARIRKGRTEVDQAIAEAVEGTISVGELILRFIHTFPELRGKYEEESNRKQYLYLEHAERVIGQYLRHFGQGKHPLASAAAMVKLILFHDMDKFRGRAIHEKKGVGDEAEIAEVVKHTGLSPAHVRARFARRLEREGKSPIGDKESAAEHVLPAMMMERYAALFASPDEARLAIAMMDGDPIGTVAKSAGADKPKLAELPTLVKHAFVEVVEMAGRAGIPPTDHAGIAAFYYQLLAFYQADSSSYSTEGRHTGETVKDRPNDNLNKIYARDGVGPDAAITKHDTDGKGTYAGFLQYANPLVAAQLAALTLMFDDVGKHVREHEQAEQEKRQPKSKPKDPAPPQDDSDDDYAANMFGALFGKSDDASADDAPDTMFGALFGPTDDTTHDDGTAPVDTMFGTLFDTGKKDDDDPTQSL